MVGGLTSNRATPQYPFRSHSVITERWMSVSTLSSFPSDNDFGLSNIKKCIAKTTISPSLLDEGGLFLSGDSPSEAMTNPPRLRFDKNKSVVGGTQDESLLSENAGSGQSCSQTKVPEAQQPFWCCPSCGLSKKTCSCEEETNLRQGSYAAHSSSRLVKSSELSIPHHSDAPESTLNLPADSPHPWNSKQFTGMQTLAQQTTAGRNQAALRAFLDHDDERQQQVHENPQVPLAALPTSRSAAAHLHLKLPNSYRSIASPSIHKPRLSAMAISSLCNDTSTLDSSSLELPAHISLQRPNGLGYPEGCKGVAYSKATNPYPMPDTVNGPIQFARTGLHPSVLKKQMLPPHRTNTSPNM